MNSHTIRSFSLTSERLDPAFHIAAARMDTAVKKLEENGVKSNMDEAMGLVAEFTSKQRSECLGVLRTGQQEGVMRISEAQGLVMKYPSLALALMQEALPSVVKEATKDLEQAQARLDALTTVRTNATPSAKRKAGGPR